MRWKAKVGITALFVAFVSAVALNIYFIRDDSDGSLLWNADEAYLFIRVQRRGVHVSYLGYPWALFKESFLYAPRSTDDAAVSVTVIRMTQSSVERHLVNVPDPSPGIAPSDYTPLEGSIYANCPELGGLCKWTGERFEAATPDEQRKFGGIDHLVVDDMDNVSGWSKKVMLGNGNQFMVDVGGKFSLSVRNEATGARESPRISIDLLHSGGLPEQLIYLDETPRRVSRSVYQRAFRAH